MTNRHNLGLLVAPAIGHGAEPFSVVDACRTTTLPLLGCLGGDEAAQQRDALTQSGAQPHTAAANSLTTD